MPAEMKAYKIRHFKNICLTQSIDLLEIAFAFTKVLLLVALKLEISEFVECSRRLKVLIFLFDETFYGRINFTDQT